MDGKTKAIVAHITLIGWIIALVINASDKDEFASFYIRQNLGIILAGMASGILVVIPLVGWLIPFVVLAFWIISLIGAIQGEMKELPWVGKYFQEWFKAL